MTKHYIILAIISIFIGTATAQQSELPKTLPFFKSHAATAIRPSTATALQKAKAINSTAETTYTHRIDSVIVLMYDQTNTNIAILTKITCLYKGNQLIEMDNYAPISTDSKYAIQYKDIYTYDTQNRVDSMYSLYYSGTSEVIDREECLQYKYDTDGKVSSVGYYTRISSSDNWYLSYTTYYQYIGSNLSTETQVSNYTDSENEYNYHYFDAYKNDTLVKNYYTVMGVKHPGTATHIKYSYGSAGNIMHSSKSEYMIDYPDSTIQSISSNTTINYDINGNIDNYSQTDYNSSTGTINSQVSFTTTDIDLNYKTAEILGYDKLKFPIYPNNMTKQWNINIAGIVLTYKFYYSPLIKDGLSNTNISEAVKVLSGNTKGAVQFQMPSEAAYTISIFTTSGSKIQTLHTTSQTNTIKNLAAGVYFYTISSEKNNYNGKFIVK